MERYGNFRDLLRCNTDINPDISAYEFLDGNDIVRISYKQFGQDITKLCSFLCERYSNKIHVGVIGENCYEWALICFSTLYSGNVIVPIDKDVTEKALADIINYSDINVLFVGGKYADKVNNIKEKIPNVDSIFTFGNTNRSEKSQLRGLMDEQEGNSVQLHDIDADSLAVLLFTSGTTGKSEGVMLSQRNLLADSYAYNTLPTLPDHEKVLNILPMHHSFPLLCDLVRSICIGGTVCISRGIRYFEKEMQVFKPYAIHTVPLIAKNLIVKAKMLSEDCVCEEERIKCVRDFFGGRLVFFVCGGAYITKDITNDYNMFGIKLIRGYGTTECSPVVSMMGAGKLYDFTTIGTVIPCNEVRIKDGEIQVKGENVMIGYYKNPEKTKKAIVDGWFSTGDIGYLENDNLYICGRNKNIIILSNGKNVYPEEIEEFFSEFDDVSEVVVFELKRPNSDGVIAAIIHVSQGIYNNKELLQGYVDKVNSNLPSFKKIRKYYVTESKFDRTSTNKIIRKNAIERGIKMEIQEQIYKILSKMTNYNPEDFTPDTNIFVDLGLDSVTVTDLVLKCEKTFQITVQDDKIAELTTIGDVVKLISDETKDVMTNSL